MINGPAPQVYGRGKRRSASTIQNVEMGGSAPRAIATAESRSAHGARRKLVHQRLRRLGVHIVDHERRR